MEKQYVLTENQLISLLASRFELAALESAGVDNWSGYDFYREMYFETSDFEKWDFEELAKESLDTYTEFNKIIRAHS